MGSYAVRMRPTRMAMHPGGQGRRSMRAEGSPGNTFGGVACGAGGGVARKDRAARRLGLRPLAAGRPPRIRGELSVPEKRSVGRGARP